MGRRVVVPEHIYRTLEAFFGPGVRDVVIIEHSLFARLHLNIEATTRRRRIYLVGSATSFFTNPELMLHEYCHVLKQWEPGHLTTLRYILEWFRNGYWNNRFEVEARTFAAEHLLPFRVMLWRGSQPSSASRR